MKSLCAALLLPFLALGFLAGLLWVGLAAGFQAAHDTLKAWIETDLGGYPRGTWARKMKEAKMSLLKVVMLLVLIPSALLLAQAVIL